MKLKFFAASLCVLAVALTSCGGSESASSGSTSGCFGDIITAQKQYDETKAKLEGSMDENNYKSKQEEVKKLKEETLAKIEKEATALNGKDVDCTAEASQLNIEQPVTLVFDSMNHLRPVFKLGGNVVAAADLNLKADPGDLAGEKLLSGAEVSVTVTMPVALDILDKDGNVLKHMDEIGTLAAENLKTSAVVKAGTPVQLSNTFVVDEAIEGAASFRLSVDLAKAPNTRRGLN